MNELKTVLAMWQKDCVIDTSNLAEASKQTPSLHAKYLQLYAEAKTNLKRVEHAQKVLLKDKWLHYNGKMSKEDIEKRGWSFDPLDGLRVLKTDMDMFYDSDPEIQESEEKIAYWKNVCEVLSEIIDNLKWRHQTIGNIIKWKVFESGG